MRIYFRRLILISLLSLTVSFLWVSISKEITENKRDNRSQHSHFSTRNNDFSRKTTFRKKHVSKPLRTFTAPSVITNDVQWIKKNKKISSRVHYQSTLSRRRLTTRYTQHNKTYSSIHMSRNTIHYKKNNNNNSSRDIQQTTKLHVQTTIATTRNINKKKKEQPRVYQTLAKNLPKSECGNMHGIPEGKYQTWQLMTKSRDAWVFSAFYENLTGPFIRIIGAKARWISADIHCQLWFNVTSGSKNTTHTKLHLVVVSASVKNIPEDHGRKFAACYFLCPLHQLKVNVPPISVSIVLKKKCQLPRNHILVTPNSVASEKDKKNFTVCLSPLHLNYNRIYELVEWVEINKLFGADYFTFYNTSISRNVTAIIKKYTEEGFIETVDWKIPFKTVGGSEEHHSEIHYYGQLAAINDCLYRNMYRTKYIVFIDADEMIIPKIHRDWMSLIDSLKHATNIGAYIFKCTFFRKEWEDTKENFTGKDIAKKYNVISLLKLDREPKIHPVYIRSKTIVNPLKVETVGIHNIWSFRTGYVASEIGNSQGLVHHYRSWQNPKDKQKVHDTTILAYKDSILKRITERWKILEKTLQEVKQ